MTEILQYQIKQIKQIMQIKQIKQIQKSPYKQEFYLPLAYYSISFKGYRIIPDFRYFYIWSTLSLHEVEDQHDLNKVVSGIISTP